MEGDMGRGIRYAGLYALKLAVMVVAVLALCWYLLDLYLSTVPSDVGADVSALVVRALTYVPPLLVTVPLAFVAGYFPAGSRNRLVARLALNAYLVVVTLLITSDFSFTLEDVRLVESPDIFADTISLSVDARLAGCVLLLIPACSVADALIEARYTEY